MASERDETSMANERLKVLYIAGWGRSGSTILGNILGQLDGFFSVGELHLIWKNGLLENRLCGCGQPFRECAVWRSILGTAFSHIDRIDVHEMLYWSSKIRSRHLPLLLTPIGRQLFAARLRKYTDTLEKLYHAVRSHTGSRVVVDFSKLPSYGALVGLIPSIDLYVVHLVRDARAVAYSWWRRSKFQPDAMGKPVYLKLRNPVKSALVSDVWNVAIEFLWPHSPGRYLRLRYEDFVNRPRAYLEEILELVGESPLRSPFVTERTVELGIHHTVSGNPSRFHSGMIELRADEEWRQSMKRSEQLIVSALTWPLQLRYGYWGKV